MDRKTVEEELNNLFFLGDFPKKLSEKMKKEANVWFGTFNPPFSLRERVSQFLGQSAFIRFGDALENIINKIIVEHGFIPLQRKIQSNNYDGKKNKNLDYDLIFSKEKIGYVGEMKIRDNHDSTKKTGQAEDLERKIRVAQEEYNELSFKGIAFYVDNNIHKNGKSVIDFINSRNKFEVHLCYGKELFDFLGIPKAQWTEFKMGVEIWSNNNKPMMETYANLIAESHSDIKTVLDGYLKRSSISEDTHSQLISIINEYKTSN